MVERLRNRVSFHLLIIMMAILFWPSESIAGRCVMQSFSGDGFSREQIEDPKECRSLCEKHQYPAPALCEFDPENGNGKQTILVQRDQSKCIQGLEVRLVFSSYFPLEEQLRQRVLGNAYSRGLLPWAELNGCAVGEPASGSYHWRLAYMISPQTARGQQARLVLRSLPSASRKDRAVLEADREVASLTAADRKLCENGSSESCPKQWREAFAFATSKGASSASMAEVLRNHSESVFTAEQLGILHRLAVRRPGRGFALHSSWALGSDGGVSALGSFLVDRSSRPAKDQ